MPSKSRTEKGRSERRATHPEHGKEQEERLKSGVLLLQTHGKERKRQEERQTGGAYSVLVTYNHG